MTEPEFKGDWHMVLGLVFAASCAYNVMRFVATHSRRNALNGGVYGALTWWEITNARHHWSQT